MRIVHLSPHLGATAVFPAVVEELARAQAGLCGGQVLAVAAAREARLTRVDDLELRTFPTATGGWLGRSPGLREHLLRVPCEVLHVHGCGERSLDYAHRAAQRHGAALIIAPHGAFGVGHAGRWPLRRALGRLLLHPQALEQAAGWHAESGEEAEAIHAAGFHQPVCVAPPGIRLPSADAQAGDREWWLNQYPELAGRRVALTFASSRDTEAGRELRRLWAATAPAGWTLLVVAPDAGQAARLAAGGARHERRDCILITGPGAAAPQSVAHLYLDLSRPGPALDEVATALAAGVPAVVVDHPPWRRLEAEQGGWCLPPADWPATLPRLLALSPNELVARGQAARAFAARELSWTRAAELLLAFYRRLQR